MGKMCMGKMSIPSLLLLVFCSSLCSAQLGDGRSDNNQIPRETTYACQFSILELRCPEHHVIRIAHANYGRFSRRLCNPHGIGENWNLQCRSYTAAQVISSKCDGHETCQVPVNDNVFVDPCPGTLKYVQVQHYCEPAPTDADDHGVKPFPDANRPLLSTVPVPEKLRVCVHPMARLSVYDLYWEMPPSHQTILHFMIKYRVNEVNREKEVTQAIRPEDNRYVYAFRPDEDLRSFLHEFAVKAYALNIGWGDYSAFVPAIHCHFDSDGNLLTLDPVETETTMATTVPKDGGGLQQMCEPVTLYGVYWPETAPGEVRTASCPSFAGGRGTMRYKCLSDGVWDMNGPEIDQCSEDPDTTKKPTTTTTTTTTTTPTTTTPTTTTPKREVPMPISFNPKVTSILQSLGPPGSSKKEKYNLTSFLPSVTQNWAYTIEATEDPRKKRARADDFKESMLTLRNELLKDDDAWKNMSVTQQRYTAASILDSVERSGLLAASTMRVGTSDTTRKANVVMKVMKVDARLGQAAILEDRSPATGSRSKVNRFTIPPAVLNQTAGPRGVPVVFVVMSDISEWLTPKTAEAPPVGDNVIDAREPDKNPTRQVVNTDVVSVSVSNRPMKNLVEPVEFQLEHRQTESVANAQCAFWDTELSGWSSEGCEKTHTNKTHTVCTCNHLTSFAVLMDITGATLDIPTDARFSLELITYIGCTISIICLLLSWVTFTCLKNLDSDRNTIHKHLVFCLMIAQIVLVVGIQQTQPPVLCSIIAGVLHFFFLASFAWMCLEGVQLYVMLIEVFESEQSRVLYYYLFGYGVPSIIVAVSAAVYSGGYGTPHHCWLTTERGFIWSFVGPAMAVLLVNVVMLGIAISTMVRHSSISHTMRQKTVPQKMRSWLKGAVVLMVLLGLTWVFGVLYLDNVYHTLIFSYVFTILNSLQGLFIFLFHCLLNEKVQKEYRRMMRQGRWLPDCLRSRYAYATSSDSRENSSSGNMVARWFRGKRGSSGGTDSNNSAKPFLHKDKRYMSSSDPSSSDGVTSSRLSSENSNNNNRKLSQSTGVSGAPDGRFLRPVEMEGLAGELSEVLDCSVVDSEFVSEYCQQNMRVSSEARRYSTSSEDSGGGDELDEDSAEDVDERLDRLAALSEESLSKRRSQVSTSDLDEVEKRSEEKVKMKDEAERGGVTAASRSPAHQPEATEEDEEEGEEIRLMANHVGNGPVTLEPQPHKIRQTESERVLIHNAANKPQNKGQTNPSPKHSPSLTHIPVTNQEAEPVVHISVPCLKFSPGTTLPPCAGDSEKDHVVISLPNLDHAHTNGMIRPPQQLSPPESPTKRHSSDGRLQFSPPRMSGSEC